MVKKHLITTSHQATWPNKNKKVIFLGEWCKLYSNEDKWDNFDYETLNYHWDKREKLERDYHYLNDFYEKTLNNISTKMNDIHHVNYNVRYWRILIGPWLALLIQSVFDRWEMIQVAINSKYELKTNIIIETDENWIATDFESFKKFVMENDGWNNFIYGKIIELFKGKIEVDKINVSDFKYIKKNLNKVSFKSFILRLYQTIANFINSNRSSLIISSYLSKVDEIILSLKLFQLPLFININKSKECLPDISQRKWKLSLNTNSEFESFIHNIIPLQIPTSYLEGYKSLNKKIKKLNWPKSPKSIFTSNSMYGDELFKHYAGIHSESSLIIGQHGGSYGISKINFSEYHELSIADNYLSWGWTNKSGNSKVHPIGQLNNKPKVKSNKTKLLIITNVNPRYSYNLYSMTISSQWLFYFEDQISLIKKLNSSVIDSTTIRLYRTDYGWNQIERWRDRFPNLKYDLGYSKIEKLYNQTKLHLATYNATSYLETIRLNIPTVIFWNPNYWENRDSIKPLFEELKRVKVYHETPESASKHINEIWDNVEGWWESSEVQEVMDVFNKSVNIFNKNITSDLKDILK